MKHWLKNSTLLRYGYNSLIMLKNLLLLLKTRSLSPQLDVPKLTNPTSQMVTANQFFEFPYLRWSSEMHNAARLNRKQWEFVYILQVLYSLGFLQTGKRGLAFGCGQEPLPAVMAKYGCDITATDLEWETAKKQGWVDSCQHANSFFELPNAKIISPSKFKSRIAFKTVNMNFIPDDLKDYDFLWSCCAFEHLGSIEHGLNFVQNAMKCLKPGGIAVHTTEFNLSSNTDTFESTGLSLFRRHDIERLQERLSEEGHQFFPVNWNSGNTPLDRYVDYPPYALSPHIKLEIEKYTCTSIGLIIRKVL